MTAGIPPDVEMLQCANKVAALMNYLVAPNMLNESRFRPETPHDSEPLT